MRKFGNGASLINKCMTCGTLRNEGDCGACSHCLINLGVITESVIPLPLAAVEDDSSPVSAEEINLINLRNVDPLEII